MRTTSTIALAALLTLGGLSACGEDEPGEGGEAAEAEDKATLCKRAMAHVKDLQLDEAKDDAERDKIEETFAKTVGDPAKMDKQCGMMDEAGLRCLLDADAMPGVQTCAKAAMKRARKVDEGAAGAGGTTGGGGDAKVDALSPTSVKSAITRVGKNRGYAIKDTKKTKIGWSGTFQIGTQAKGARTYRFFKVSLASMGGKAGRRVGQMVEKQASKQSNVAYRAGNEQTVIVVCAAEAASHAPGSSRRCRSGEARKLLNELLK